MLGGNGSFQKVKHMRWLQKRVGLQEYYTGASHSSPRLLDVADGNILCLESCQL
jgi:hypothetical protein